MIFFNKRLISPKKPSKRTTFIVCAVLGVLFITGGGYWVYQSVHNYLEHNKISNLYDKSKKTIDEISVSNQTMSKNIDALNSKKIELEKTVTDNIEKIKVLEAEVLNLEKAKDHYINISATLSAEKVQATEVNKILTSENHQKDDLIDKLNKNITLSKEETATLISQVNDYKIKTLNFIEKLQLWNNESISMFEDIMRNESSQSEFYGVVISDSQKLSDFLNEYHQEISKQKITASNSGYLNRLIGSFYVDLNLNLRSLDINKNKLFGYYLGELQKRNSKISDLTFENEVILSSNKKLTSEIERLNKQVIANQEKSNQLSLLLESARTKNIDLEKALNNYEISMYSIISSFISNNHSLLKVLEASEQNPDLYKLETNYQESFREFENKIKSFKTVQYEKFKAFENTVETISLYNKQKSRYDEFLLNYFSLLLESNKTIANKLQASLDEIQELKIEKSSTADHINHLKATNERNQTLIAELEKDKEMLNQGIRVLENKEAMNAIESERKDETIQNIEKIIKAKDEQILLLREENQSNIKTISKLESQKLELESAILNSNTQIEELNKELSKTEAEIISLNATIEYLNKEVEKKNQIINDLVSKNSDLTLANEKATSENKELINVLKETEIRINNLITEKSELSNNLEKSSSENSKLINTNEELLKEKIRLETINSDITSKNNELENAFNSLNLEKLNLEISLGKVTNDKNNLSQENAKLKSNLNAINEIIKEKERQILEIRLISDSHTTEIAEKTKALENALENLNSEKSKWIKLHNQNESLILQLTSLEEKLAKKEAEISALNVELIDLKDASSNSEESINSTNEKLKLANETIELLRTENEEYEIELDEMNYHYDKNLKELKKVEAEKDQLLVDLANKNREVDGLVIALNSEKAKNRVTEAENEKLRNELDNLENISDQQDEMISDLIKEKEKIKKEVEDANNKFKKLENSYYELEEERQTLLVENAKYKNLYNDKVAKYEAMKQKVNTFLTNLNVSIDEILNDGIRGYWSKPSYFDTTPRYSLDTGDAERYQNATRKRLEKIKESLQSIKKIVNE
ncbi:hypothetical protein [Mycoplasma sp. Ms02]|uniref:hypothetical protein n=1 Tax=Mycoplasma sp. Ms02 TaxID=353851 RepID=UPI001C8B02F3|nr:hypothetical protein [Mycoplasma sp. Ms02]QZE12336.1 hypothetical protein K4L35_03315 [Mycoplasma sp. Ms02]